MVTSIAVGRVITSWTDKNMWEVAAASVFAGAAANSATCCLADASPQAVPMAAATTKAPLIHRRTVITLHSEGDSQGDRPSCLSLRSLRVSGQCGCRCHRKLHRARQHPV